jgi:hypothetical protein
MKTSIFYSSTEIIVPHQRRCDGRDTYKHRADEEFLSENLNGGYLEIDDRLLKSIFEPQVNNDGG